MSNHYDRQLLHRNRMLSVVGDIYFFGKQCKKTGTVITQEIRDKVYGSPSWKVLTAYERGYVQSRIDYFYDQIWACDLEWRVLLDGVYVYSKAVPDDRLRDCVRGCHFWKGTDVPFGTPSDDFFPEKKEPAE